MISRAGDRRVGATLAAVLAAAAAELLLGALAPLPAGYPRAEAVVFLSIRPWLLLPLSMMLTRLPWRMRLLHYAAFLASAGLGASVYLLWLGNGAPWPEMLRGWVAAVLLLLLIDPLLALARKRFGAPGVAVAAIAIAAILATPPATALYRNVLVRMAPKPAQSAARPRLLLMTALPLVWGEGGAFDPESRPAAAYTVLQAEFTVAPIDAIDRTSLAGARLLLLAQPRWLAPAELVALDDWVRGGGRVLILTDPRLGWPSELPLGDIRRPPPIGLLKPLLEHWGVALRNGSGSAVALPRGRRLVLEDPGRFAVASPACRLVQAELAECAIGKGRAILLADADLMRDDLWLGPGNDGAARHRRRADNPLVVADLLDRLAGSDRPRALGDVHWADPDRSRGGAILAGLLTLLAVAGAVWAGLRLRHRRAKR